MYTPTNHRTALSLLDCHSIVSESDPNLLVDHRELHLLHCRCLLYEDIPTVGLFECYMSNCSSKVHSRWPGTSNICNNFLKYCPISGIQTPTACLFSYNFFDIFCEALRLNQSEDRCMSHKQSIERAINRMECRRALFRNRGPSCSTENQVVLVVQRF